MKIPRGTVKSYIEVAKGINMPYQYGPLQMQLVGTLSSSHTCHRVIRSDGTLGGYSGKVGLKPRDYCLKTKELSSRVI